MMTGQVRYSEPIVESKKIIVFSAIVINQEDIYHYPFH